MRRLLTALLGVAACSGQDPEETAAVPAVRILLDGAEVASVAVRERRPLRDLVPADPAQWRVLDARSGDGRFLSIRQPAGKYPDHEAALYVAGNGMVSVGMFRKEDPSWTPEARARLQAPGPFLVGAVEVHVRTKEEKVEKPPPAALTLAAGGKEMRLMEEQLAALPAVDWPVPGEEGGGKHREGWRLRDVIALGADPAKTTTIRLRAETGAQLQLSREDIGENALIKRNRRGEFVFRILEGGKVRGLRGVVRIEVE